MQEKQVGQEDKGHFYLRPMKFPLLFLIFLFPMVGKAQLPSTGPTQIEDGTYESSVNYYYYGHLAYNKAKYQLDVEVLDNRVVAIYFGNGGLVHTGDNNEGYTYSGGTLSTFLSTITTTVTVYEGNSKKVFYITLL